MKIIKYFIEFIFIIILFFIFKIIGYKNASNLGEIIGKKIGPFFRSRSKIQNNLINSNIGNSYKDRMTLINNMWGNYGRILSEYIYLKKFRKNILDEFIEIEKARINLCTIYRTLNNPFLNIIMEKIRKENICKNQIKKGKSGTKELLKLFKKNFSVALMIDQRVSEGQAIEFFKRSAKTTTIPAQLVKKYNCRIVPVYIERIKGIHFKLSFNKAIKFDENLSIEQISLELNKFLEKMILKNPDQWIWTHDRWK